MIDRIIDNNTIVRIANSFSVQNGLSIGIYDEKGEAILACPDFSESDCLSAISKLGASSVENIIDFSTSGSRTSAMAMRDTNGTLLGMWMIKAKPSDSVPFDSHLTAIETLVSAYLLEREQALNLSNNVRDKEIEESNLNRELKQNIAITEILSKLESEDDFEKVTEQILKIAGEFLELSDIFVLQFDRDDDTVSILVRWQSESGTRNITRLDSSVLSEIPFADGLSYTISSDSRMPEAFREYLTAYDISAGIFLPILLDDENVMYLCATMESVPRHWSLSEAGFLSDVKRIISTILAKRIAKNSLASSFAVIESVLENIGCGVMVLEQGEGNVLYTNDTFHTMFSNLSDRQRFERRIRQTPEKMEQIREYFVESTGAYVSIALGTIRWVDDSPVRLATVFDISENKEFEKRIEKQANIDELTGIYNRTYFIKELGNILSKPHESGAYICLNIDGFKEVNVTSGNDSGDILLSAVAKFLLKLSDDNVRVYRLGADEFGIIILDQEKNDPAELSKSIIKRFGAPWQLAYKDCYLTVSIGVSLFPKDGDDVSSVVKTGGIALSEARSNGPGSMVFFASWMESKLKKNILLRSFLTDSIDNNCNGMEAKASEASFLINNATFEGDIYDFIWNAPEFGILEHQDYMPIARRINANTKVVEKLFFEATRACRDKNDFGYPEYVAAIPVDAAEFETCDLVQIVSKSLEESSVNSDRIVVILRGAIHSDFVNKVEDDINALKKLGVHIASSFVLDKENLKCKFDAEIVSK